VWPRVGRLSGDLGDLLDVQQDIERLHRQLRPTAAVSAQTIKTLHQRLLALSGTVFAASGLAEQTRL
jgi:hypothetical protein